MVVTAESLLLEMMQEQLKRIEARLQVVEVHLEALEMRAERDRHGASASRPEPSQWR